jgi:hypothetical protein
MEAAFAEGCSFESYEIFKSTLDHFSRIQFHPVVIEGCHKLKARLNMIGGFFEFFLVFSVYRRIFLKRFGKKLWS